MAGRLMMCEVEIIRNILDWNGWVLFIIPLLVATVWFPAKFRHRPDARQGLQFVRLEYVRLDRAQPEEIE